MKLAETALRPLRNNQISGAAGMQVSDETLESLTVTPVSVSLPALVPVIV